MGNYNNDRRGGGRSSGGFGGRSQGRSEMHPATCSDCGNRCEVPFRPTGDKPVYCRDCFRKEGDSGSDRPGRPSFGKFGKKDFGRSNFEDKQMHPATCSDCGSRCEVPFRPTGEKPVYCSDCFGGNKGKDFEPKKPDRSAEQFEQLNKKLDKILRVLEVISPKKTFIIEKSEEKPETVEPEKKVPKKKAAPKKAAKAAKSKKEKKVK